MDVYFLNFTKKLNSTGQPPITSSTPKYDCKLKSGCDVLRPVLELSFQVSTMGTITNANYSYIPDFRRYYWVKNWHFANAKIICELEVDVLATYKSNIEHSYQYVLRSASHYDPNITDTKYPIKAEAPTIVAGYYANNPLLPPPNGDGVVVCGIVNHSGSITGCVSYYVMGIYAFSELCTKLFTLSTQWGAGGQDIADGIKKAITDPFQYFVSATWLPYAVADFTARSLATQTTAVFVGYDTITLTNYAYVFNDKIEIAFTNVVRFSIPYHPQSATRGNYMNFAPYSRYYMSFYPFCGFAELDGAAFAGLTYLYALYTIDLRTGKGILNICKDTSGSDTTYYTDFQPSQIVRTFEAQVGVDIPIAAIHTALPQSLADSKMMAIGAAATGASEFGGFEGLFNKIAATATDIFATGVGASEEAKQAAFKELGAQPFNRGDISKIAQGAFACKTTCELLGGQGTMSFNYHMPVAFWGEFVNAADESTTLNGRPLCRYRELVISSNDALTGYICCDNAKIVAPSGSYPPEVAEIENFLTGGMFLE